MKYRPRGNHKKSRSIGTPQGRHTLISLLICAILGMILSRILPSAMLKLRPMMSAGEAQEVGILIALVISGLTLVVMLLKPTLLKGQKKPDG